MNNYLVTSEDISGPWTDPIYLNSSGFDPSLFHDIDGKKYLANNVYDYRNYNPWNYGIQLQEYDVEKRKLIGNPEIIFKGTDLQKTEAPHIYYINGYYYLFTAEGGTQWGHAVTVARSKCLFGPYEVHPDNPILTAWYSPENILQKTGHGSIIKTDSEEWYITFLVTRPIKRKGKGIFEERGFSNLGRETAIAKLEWSKDGWPYIIGGKVAKEFVEAPNLREHKWPEERKSTKFKDGIPTEFQTLRVPFDEKMGKVTRHGLVLYGQESLYSVFDQSLIARRYESKKFEAQTEVEFTPESFQQMAGLICFYNTKNWTSLCITHDESIGKVLRIMQCEGSSISWPLDRLIELSNNKSVFLKVNVNDVNYVFSYSIDNHTWIELPVKFDTYKLSDDYITRSFLGPYGSAFTGSFVGIHCNDLAGTRIPAIFKQFKYEDL